MMCKLPKVSRIAFAILLAVLFYVNDSEAFSKYGRTCQDIICPSTYECVIKEDLCPPGKTAKCGKYPDCKKVNKPVLEKRKQSSYDGPHSSVPQQPITANEEAQLIVHVSQFFPNVPSNGQKAGLDETDRKFIDDWLNNHGTLPKPSTSGGDYDKATKRPIFIFKKIDDIMKRVKEVVINWF
ncbi:uncharacterized protein LOC106641831 [Copidosoma floridanum]|uniref:uncharacterized protein LOC106641831 n=1 Tax=Copidosoma floridanum TaxID=29053 RepID=UPI0006C9C21E|nr:uncharacterized protein LOC106641831 [Copidosoma floridanum]